MPRVVAIVASAIVVAATCCAIAAGSGGSLDPTFGGDGRVVTDLGSDDGAGAVAVLPDGKLLVAAGQALVRYASSGALDATFDGDGVLPFPFSQFFASDMAIAPDGKVVLVGWASNPGTGADIAVARFTSDGTPDATFSDDGLVTKDLGDGDFASGVVVQPDGKVVVVANTDIDHGTGVVGRFLADGSPDPSFRFRSAFFSLCCSPASANDVALQPDGKIVVVGSATKRSNCCDNLTFAVARFRTDGSRDKSFGGDGVVRTAFSNWHDGALAVAIQADGKIVAGGYTATYAGSDFALARYKPGGRLDTAFSGDGKVQTEFGGPDDTVYGVALQANGRILLAGEAGRRLGFRQRFAVARYRAGGKLDDTFSRNGKKRTRFGSNDGDVAYDVAVQANGRILLAGRVKTSAGTIDIGLARYLP